MLSVSILNKFVLKNNTRWVRLLHAASDSYLHNPGTEPLTYATLGDVIEETVHKYPGRVAVKSMYEGITLTYEELLTQADSLAYSLRNQGLGKGDRVGVWSHNSVPCLVLLVAAARAGLISVLINPAYQKKELSFCLKKTEVKSLLIGDALPNRNYYGTLEQLIPELKGRTTGSLESKEFPSLISIIADGRSKLDGTLSYKSLTEDYKNRNEVSEYGKEVTYSDGTIIHFTSGTTGEPKAALDSHLGVVNNTYFTGKRNKYHEGHNTICVQAPMFHALGSIVAVLGGIRHGASLVLAAPTYNIPANVKALFSEKCTAIAGTPTMYVDILSYIRTHPQEVPSSLRVATTGGAPCSPQLIRDIQKHLNAESVKGLYGMTETTASIFQSIEGDSIDVVSDTVGYIQDHVEIKVVDEQGDIVPFDTPGELLARGYNNMICYWNDPEKTIQTVDKDGWLKTGDKFTISKDGYGRIVGRLKDIIVRGGENIAPKEIEDLLNTHPDVEESQVVGVSDERVGEELCAVLRLKEGASVTFDDITKHLTGEIARFKFPRILKIVETFPKTASGKIQKYKLREMIEKGAL